MGTSFSPLPFPREKRGKILQRAAASLAKYNFTIHKVLTIEGNKATQPKFINDPTAGSPTVTLLRLLLPLNDQV